MLLLAASSLGGQSGTDTIIGAHAAIVLALGGGIGLIFTIGLLASGLASTSVGAYAGVEIMSGLTHRRIPLLVQRLITLVPAIVVLAVFQNPTSTLVVSQVILSFCIPFAVVPLVVYTSRKELMGKYANNLAIKILAWAAAAIIIVFNVILLVMTL
jgi:manganese transport protein